MKNFLNLFLILSIFLSACAASQNDESSKPKPLSNYKEVADMPKEQAAKYLYLLDSIEGENKATLMLSLASAGVEEVRQTLLNSIEDSSEDYESLCALWALEKLQKQTDVKTLNALWAALTSNKPRSKDYAFELFITQAPENANVFLKGKLSESTEARRLAIKLAAAMDFYQMFADIANVVGGNEALKLELLNDYSPVIRQEQFDEYLKLSRDLINQEKVQNLLLKTSLRLAKREETKAFIKSLEANPETKDTAQKLSNKLPPKYPLMALDVAIVDASKKEILTSQKVVNLAKMGYSGISVSYNRLVELEQPKLSETVIDTKMAYHFEVYTKMRQANLRATSLYIVAKFEDGVLNFPVSTSEILQYARPMNATIWLAVIGKRDGKNTDEALAKFIDSFNMECAKSDIKLHLYPHDVFYIEDFEDAQKVLENCKIKNVKIVYNIPHEFMAIKGKTQNPNPEDMANFVLKNSTLIDSITICGIDDTQQGVGKIIVPLGMGNFDTKKFCDTLFENNFKGSILLQGYGTWRVMPIEEAAAKSMQTWRKWYE